MIRLGDSHLVAGGLVRGRGDVFPIETDCLRALNDGPRGRVVAVGLGRVLQTADVICGRAGFVGDEAGGGAGPTAILEKACVPGRREVADDFAAAAAVLGLGAEGSESCGEEKGGTHVDVLDTR